ncbi:MAG TPA: hypothetical protein VGF87_01445 [Acidimicrobiales bacterium]
MAPSTSRTPISTLLSQALVAFTIELDNEAEHRLPHRTTREDDAEASDGAPWLVSYPLWANVLRYVGPEGTSVADLRARARTSRLLLGGLRRWRYVRLTPPGAQALKNPPHDDTLVRLTRHARAAGEVWRALPAQMDARWRSRFGDPAMDALAGSLGAVYSALAVDPPDYLPPVFPTQNGRAEPPMARTPAPQTSTPGTALDLSVLLSGVLFAFTVDFEQTSRIALPIAANTLRVLDETGVRVRDLPVRTGVSKEANAMAAGWLERRGCAERLPDPSASRGQVLRLTRKGLAAYANSQRRLAETEEAWRSTHGEAALDSVRHDLEPLVGDGTLPSSPLAAGLEPPPGTWRSSARRPQTLPHYPMVLHRGAYPDGS